MKFASSAACFHYVLSHTHTSCGTKILLLLAGSTFLLHAFATCDLSCYLLDLAVALGGIALLSCDLHGVDSGCLVLLSR